jgi:hypothetical protein
MEARVLEVVADSRATTLLVSQPVPGFSCRSLVSGVINDPAAAIIFTEHMPAVCCSRRR